MKRLMMNLWAAALLAALAVMASGCSTTVTGTPSGASTVRWGNGTLKSQEYASFSQGWNAAIMAMNQLGFAVVGQENDQYVGNITARAPGDKKITIKVLKVSGTIVSYEILVGTWGDKTVSLEILSAIRKRL